MIPKPDSDVPKPPHPYSVPHGDIRKAAEKTLAWAQAQDWLGDSVPGCLVTFAPDHFALLLGAGLRYDNGSESGMTTSWVLPCLESYDDEIRFRPEGVWWEKTVECIRVFRAVCDGHLVVSGTNLQGGLDALSAIRGPERLLMDLLDCPEGVKTALRQIDQALIDVRKALAEELDIATWGSVTRHGYYGTGLVDVPQCDFSAMISPEAFREFALPSLIRECAGAQGNYYHLDGKEALRHLPALAEIPGINGIQWQPGDRGIHMDWSKLYRQIDDLGLGLIRGGSREDVRGWWRNLKNRHWLYVDGVKDIRTRDEAEVFSAEWDRAEDDMRRV